MNAVFKKGHEASGVVLLHAAQERQLHSPRLIVKRALRPIDRYGEWQKLARSWKPIQALTFSFARYLTLWVPSIDSDRPLITRCIEQALDGWAGLKEGASERERYHAYIRGMLYPLPEALEWRVSMAEQDQHGAWNPLENGLLEWWRSTGGVPNARRRSRPADNVFVDVPPADYRLIVLLRFLLKGDYTVTPLVGRLEYLVSRFG